MPSLKFILTASVTAIFATGNAHMLMASPQSYGKPDKSPLAADGSDFPCKATSNAGAFVTDMAIGQQQTLSFNGTAVHGGGSCQTSLTTDSPATKNSKRMVIHSIEGGCPARNTPGNFNEGADPDTTADPDTYKYSIPAGVAPGSYKLAWTWFNKVGNREMYMNCASIKVTGGLSKRDTLLNQKEQYFSSKLSERAMASFASMFVANIGNGCTTAYGGDLKFSEPGASVETNQGYIPMAPVGNCGASAGFSGSGSESGSVAPSEAATAPTVATSPPVIVAPSLVAPSAADTPPTTESHASSSSSTTSSDMASTGASTGSYSTPSQTICSPDNTHIGTCALTNTITWIKLASGTKYSAAMVVAEKCSANLSNGYLERVQV